MKLVADSGSTKTDWYLVDNEAYTTYKTQGYNPYYCTTADVQQSLEQELLKNIDALSVRELYFYGAGCSNDLTQGVIRDALSPTFKAASISLGDDLLAAARATAGHEAGICCILGTGSNSCYYDGNKIADKVPSLGYILGDEGAGTYIGRQLIKAYYYRELPEELVSKMAKEYEMDKHIIISRLLDDKHPNRFLASFAMFCSDYQEHPYIQHLVSNCFTDFLKCHVLKYPNAKQLPVHFIGSVAFGFEGILRATLEQHQMQAGKILQSPFPELLAY